MEFWLWMIIIALIGLFLYCAGGWHFQRNDSAWYLDGWNRADARLTDVCAEKANLQAKYDKLVNDTSLKESVLAICQREVEDRLASFERADRELTHLRQTLTKIRNIMDRQPAPPNAPETCDECGDVITNGGKGLCEACGLKLGVFTRAKSLV